MKKYAVIGSPITHSLSPLLHNEIFRIKNTNAVYEAVHIPPERLETEMSRLKGEYAGLNCTIPLKQRIIPLLDDISPAAKALGSVNTVKISDGKMFGASTDGEGFLRSLKKHGILPEKGDNVLIIGAGGVARVVSHTLREIGCNITLAVRNAKKAKPLLSELEKLANAKISLCGINEIKGSFSLLVQCTPVGMTPKADECPVSDEVIKSCDAVFDTVYTPIKTTLIQKAEKMRKTAVGGLEMLVFQGLSSEEIWNGFTFSEVEEERLLNKLTNMLEFSLTKNIALIGFMAAGKSTVGRVLAQEMRLRLTDTDAEIEKAEGRSVSEIFAAEGEEYFRKAETKILKKLTKEKGLILSCGGGIIGKAENVSALKENFFTVFLDVPFEILKERAAENDARPLFRDENIAKQLYEKRYPRYKAAADFTLDSSCGILESVNIIEKRLGI